MAQNDTGQAVFDLSAGHYVKGLAPPGGQNPMFFATTTFNQLQQFMTDPARLQPTARRSGYDAEEREQEAAIHELIQRALTGNKKSNVKRYADYIEEVVLGRRVGVLPPMHLFSAEQLDLISHANDQYALIPNGRHLLAIDGETQLAAHFLLRSRATAPELRQKHGSYPLSAIIHHGIDVEVARQYFHDLNVLAVRPNTSLGLSMDTIDPLMKVVGDLESAIPFLTGRVDKQSRQLPKQSPKVITVGSLRQMTINVARGIGGIQYGSRPAPVDDIDLDTLRRVSEVWFSAYFNTFGAEVSDREKSLAGAPPVLAAIGALGNGVFAAQDWERERVIEQLIADLRNVDWRKGEAWQGIAGKFTSRGVFSVGGTKEVAYAIFNVLSDRSNPAWARIRQPVEVGHD